jgi:hypothetical protein
MRVVRRKRWMPLRLHWAGVDSPPRAATSPRMKSSRRCGKTEASRKPVPLHPAVVKCLETWRKESSYGRDENFIFPSVRRNGKQPLSPDTLLQNIIRPAVKRAGIKGKTIGWHSFRHSLATNLRAAGVDLKTAQELLRHANSRITLDVYTRAISATKREADNRVMTMVLEVGKKTLSAPSKGAKPETKRGANRSSTLVLGGKISPSYFSAMCFRMVSALLPSAIGSLAICCAYQTPDSPLRLLFSRRYSACQRRYLASVASLRASRRIVFWGGWGGVETRVPLSD